MLPAWFTRQIEFKTLKLATLLRDAFFVVAHFGTSVSRLASAARAFCTGGGRCFSVCFTNEKEKKKKNPPLYFTPACHWYKKRWPGVFGE